jgi:hypothetical protein
VAALNAAAILSCGRNVHIVRDVQFDVEPDDEEV